MWRRSLMALLVVAALASLTRDVQAGNSNCASCKQKVLEYLFGGYGPGPFGKGEFSYAGQYPIDNRTRCGCKIQ